MATSYPASLDSFTNPTAVDTLDSPPHDTQHADANDAIEALQAKVGIDGSADTSSHDYLIGDLLSRIATLEAAGSPIVKVARFTSSGTWTVPAGVTYAVAHIRGGGGGASDSATANGGTSSVAFASGTVSAAGGAGANAGKTYGNTPTYAGVNGATNSGKGARLLHQNTAAGDQAYFIMGADGAEVVAGAAVTAGASITVTVGAGGNSNRYDGGSGYVWIEYQQS